MAFYYMTKETEDEMMEIFSSLAKVIALAI